jgi:tetratricopeptide (TPR) repeat protein
MNARSFLFCAVSSVLAFSCPAQQAQSPTRAPRESDFEAAIDGIRKTYPESPAILSAQLSYAEFMMSDAMGFCAQRLERAQEQLGSIDANPKTLVMFPDGWDRAADLEYRLHLARAACGSKADRDNELRTAVAAARRAVDLYRNEFDYRSMAIMQFDVSVALHELGDNAAAVAALEAALDMDREFGFQDDAADNYQQLLTWRGEPAGDAQVANLMRDFPKRQAILKFGWHASDAQIMLESRRVCLTGGQVIHSHAAAAFERRIGANDGGWSVSYVDRLARYEPGVWPTMQGSQPPHVVFAPGLLPPVSFKVSSTGEFGGVTESAAFAAQLAAKTEQLVRAAPVGDHSHDLTDDALRLTLGTLSPGMLEAATAERYQLETAMWIGATLDQGVWYEVSAPLTLPGIPQVVVQHRVEFAFTRKVSCTAGAAEQACVEIVIRATPDKDAVDQVISDSGIADYTASVEARIVTDPAALLPYALEERVYWYWRGGKMASILQSEHLISSTKYGGD